MKGDYRTTSSTTQMIASLGWPTLQQRHTDSRLVLMYRIVHNLTDIPADLYLHSAAVSLQFSRNVCFLVPFCRTDLYRHSFFPAVAWLWNPAPIATAQTLDSFKAGLASLQQTSKHMFVLFFIQHFFICHLTLPCIVTVHRCSRGALHFLGRRRYINLLNLSWIKNVYF